MNCTSCVFSSLLYYYYLRYISDEGTARTTSSTALGQPVDDAKYSLVCQTVSIHRLGWPADTRISVAGPPAATTGFQSPCISCQRTAGRGDPSWLQTRPSSLHIPGHYSQPALRMKWKAFGSLYLWTGSAASAQCYCGPRPPPTLRRSRQTP
jgi:hypothetical protein